MPKFFDTYAEATVYHHNNDSCWIGYTEDIAGGQWVVGDKHMVDMSKEELKLITFDT